MATTTGHVQKITFSSNSACVEVGPSPSSTELLTLGFDATDDNSTAALKKGMVRMLTWAQMGGVAVEVSHDDTGAHITQVTTSFPPLQPTNLRLTSGGQPHSSGSTGVPVQGVLLTWQDPGAGSRRQATSWRFEVAQTPSDLLAEQGTVQQPSASLSATLEFSTNYLWIVTPFNASGAGPSTTFEFATQAAPPLQATNIQLNVSGKPIAAANVPISGFGYSWEDPGAGSPRQATSWESRLKKVGSAFDFVTLGTSAEPRAPMNAVLEFSSSYFLIVTPANATGKGPDSPIFEFGTQARPAPPPPPPPPPAQTRVLTLQVALSLPAFAQSITEAKWLIAGPGAPPAAIEAPINGSSSQIAVPLPVPQGSASYTIRASVAFFFDSLVRNNGISGPENTQVDLLLPTTVPWTGQSRIARYAITYDSFSNTFIMSFAGLFG